MQDEEHSCCEANTLAGRAVSAPCVIMGCAIFTQPLDYIIKVKTLGRGFDVFVVSEIGGNPEAVHLSEESAKDNVIFLNAHYPDNKYTYLPIRVNI